MKKRSYKGLCGNPQCGREFIIKVRWQKYCSDRCRLVAGVLSKANGLTDGGKKD